MDLIDRKRLLDAVNRSWERNTHKDDAAAKVHNQEHRYLHGLILNQPAVYDQGRQDKDWIPCEKKLPEVHLVRDMFNRPDRYISEPVLVTVKSDECDGVHYFVTTNFMSGKSLDNVEWFRSDFYGGTAVYSQEIIAWMPEPEPYIGDNNQIEEGKNENEHDGTGN